MSIMFYALAAIACLLVPIGVEYRTGPSNPRDFLHRNFKILKPWELKFLKNYWFLQVSNSGVMFVGLVGLIEGCNADQSVTAYVSAAVIGLTLIAGMAFISWPAWISRKG